jgi:outer membrane receptor protein involved in Fe transport
MRKILLLSLLLLSTNLSATYLVGKCYPLEGLVMDKNTDQGVKGVKIILVEKAVECRTDINGYFVFPWDVRSGVYTLKAKKTGYIPIEISKLSYDPDTASIIFIKIAIDSLNPPIENAWQTETSDPTIDSRQMRRMPESTLASVLRQTPGAVIYDGQVHLRGGDHDEIAYFVDGFDVTDRHFGNFTERLPPRAITGIEITKAGFPVSIGQSMSGAIDLMTGIDQPSDEKGLIMTADDSLWNSNSTGYQRWDLFWNSGVYKLTDLRLSLNAEFTDNKGIRAYNMPEKIYVPDHAKDYIWADTMYYSHSSWDTVPGSGGIYGWVGDWADTIRYYDSLYAAGASNINGLQIWELEKRNRLVHGQMYGWKEWDKPYLPHSGSNSYMLHGRADYNIERYNAKASLTWLANREQETQYATSFKYNLDNYYAQLKKEWMLGLRFRQQISPQTSYSLGINRFNAGSQTGVIDTTAEKDRNWWEDYTFLSDTDANGDSIYDAYAGKEYDYNINNPYGVPGYFAGYGLARTWRKTENNYNGLSFKLDHQVDKRNALEGGLDFKKYRVYIKENSLPWDPYPFKDYYDFDPANLAIYLQEKLELSDMAFTVGLRMDRFMPNAEKKANNFNLTDTASYIKAQSNTLFGLRLGFLHHISPATSFRINYGRYVQQPLWDQLFTMLNANIARGNMIIGNPDLAAPYTIAYEAGINQRLWENSFFDASLYYKDVYNLIDTTLISDPTTGLNYTGYRNIRQANIRGLQLAYELKPKEMGLSLSANYSLQMAKYSKSAIIVANYYIYGGGTDPGCAELLLDPRYTDEYSLNWDQRHKLTFNLSWESDSEFGPWFLGGRPFSGISINFLNTLNSGLPYTVLGYDHGNILSDINAKRLPWVFNTDLKVEKVFQMPGVNMTLGLEVLNLFNRKNVTGVFPQTGLTDAYGTPLSYDDFAGKVVLDSLPGGIDSSGNTMMYPNPDYSKWRDLNGDGIIDSRELYITYLAAYNDFVNDPYNSLRYPESGAYAPPRRIRLILGFKF